MEVITSLDNKRIKSYAKLLNKKERDSSLYYLVEGEHLVEEAYKTDNLVEVIVTQEYKVSYNVRTTYVTYEVIKKLSKGVNPQHIIGLVKKKQEEEVRGKVLILDGVRDPGNLGTIIRSSVAFGVDTIVLSNDAVDLYNDKVLRASEGMIYKVNIVRKEIDKVIDELHSKGYMIYGTSVTDGLDIKMVEIPKNIAIVMGNEGQGVNEDILEKCDKNILIEMSNDCESLNVGVATSIILYEIYNR